MTSDFTFDAVIIGAGHNGMVCAAYLARAGFEVVVVERGTEMGGCIQTRELVDGRGRLEVGAYEVGGFVGSGVAHELELTTRWGLDLLDREELLYAPRGDDPGLAFHADLEATVEFMGAAVGRSEADAYRAFAGWSASVLQLLGVVESSSPPSISELASLARATMGADGDRLVQAMLAPASTTLRAAFADEQLQGVLGHWSALSLTNPTQPGTGFGAFHLAGLHGYPGQRPKGGARAIVDSLRRCVEGHGGSVRLGAQVDAIEVADGRATAVLSGDERYVARRAVIATIDAVRVFGDLIDPAAVPASLRSEVARIHSGHGNVTELKVDAVVRSASRSALPSGFDRAMVASSPSLDDLERAFAEIALGNEPSRQPVLVAFPSAIEPGWAPDGHDVVWIQTIVPWQRTDGPWTSSALEAVAEETLRAAGEVVGPLDVVERVVTGPRQWVDRHGGHAGNPSQVDLTLDQMLDLRPSPSLAGYATPIAGLYLSGAGTHPGGGVTGAPGRNAAQRVLSDAGGFSAGRVLGNVRQRSAMLRDAWRAVRALRSP